jgi:hypothetical protein
MLETGVGPMLTPLLLVMLGAASHNPNLKLNFTLKPPAPPTRCVGGCADRYRLPASSDDIESAKDRALADDGSKCDVIGAMRCLSKRRTLLRSNQDPIDTLRTSFLPH